jgi:acyl-CoA thioesterase II
MLDIFDVQPNGAVSSGARSTTSYVGHSDAGTRDVIDGSQLLAQAIVAAAKSFDGRSVRSAHAVFPRTAAAHAPITFDVTPVHAGRTFVTADVHAHQGERSCAAVRVLLDRPQPDVVRRTSTPARSSTPETAIPIAMPMDGRELRLVDVRDPNDPDDIGPPVLDAWLRYDVVPDRDELAKALLAHFTGHLSISTSLRPHAGIGTAMSHHSISTAVMTIGIVFHDPVRWDDWLLYEHESTAVGAGMSFVRGHVFTRDGVLLASFGQEGMIRAFAATDPAVSIAASSRL